MITGSFFCVRDLVYYTGMRYRTVMGCFRMVSVGEMLDNGKGREGCSYGDQSSTSWYYCRKNRVNDAVESAVA